MEMYKFPHIDQFRNVVRRVTDKTRFVGLDESGEPMFDGGVELPTLRFFGTTKLHGTNCSVVYNKNGEFWAQSRERIITVGDDNYGFAGFANGKREYFESIANFVMEENSEYDTVAIYGEYVGKGIQSGVAIAELPKMFVMFSIKLIDSSDREHYKWLTMEEMCSLDDSLWLKDYSYQICNIYHFGYYETVIDFEKPELIVNELIGFTQQVEQECPVAKYFGVSGVGEGIVWHCETAPYNTGDFMFKTKGEKHSVTKVKKLVTVDVERMNSINECVESIITENRLRQGLQYLTENKLEHTPENIGTFIKWVTSDATREEADTIAESGFTVKDISKAATNVAKKWFFNNTQTFNVH